MGLIEEHQFTLWFLRFNCSQDKTKFEKIQGFTRLKKIYSSQNYYDRSEAERVLFTNMVEDLVGEPVRPYPTVTLSKR